jgi:4-hydroxybenzoyl-CoA thioesterase
MAANSAGGQTFHTSMRVRFEHCDTAGIAYYPRIWSMLALVIERWFEHIGCDYRKLHLDDGEGIPAVRTECDFRRPARLGDTLEFSLNVERLGSKSITLRIVAKDRESGEPTLEARLVLVWSSIRPGPRGIPIPEAFRRPMMAYLPADPPGDR